jgi:regulator of protease activity HflC (stomatin/prohibitin superfamily)
MKTSGIILGVIVVGIFILLATIIGFERIDAGYDGIRVNKYGDEKGVDKVTEVTGAVWYNKIKFDIYEVPTHTLDYDFVFNNLKTKDIMDTDIGIGVQVRLPEGKTPQIFIDYRRYFSGNSVDLTPIINKFARQAVSDAVGYYEAEALIINKSEFRLLADSLLTARLAEIGFNCEELFLVGDPNIPEALKTNVEAKLNASIIAQKKESEIRQRNADAIKQIIDARADSASTVIRAAGEAQALRLKKQQLTPLLVQEQYINKWDGNYGTGNVYGQGALMYKQLK